MPTTTHVARDRLLRQIRAANRAANLSQSRQAEARTKLVALWARALALGVPVAGPDGIAVASGVSDAAVWQALKRAGHR